MTDVGRRLAVSSAVFGGLAFAAVAVAPLIGTTTIDFRRVFDGSIPFADNVDAQIFFIARLPRALAGALVGATLAAAGTARAASDKFIVQEPSTQANIWWGQYNRPFSAEKFDELYARLQGYLQGRDIFIQDCFGGADPRYQMPIRIITEFAWHSLFARNMFVSPAIRGISLPCP